MRLKHLTLILAAATLGAFAAIATPPTHPTPKQQGRSAAMNRRVLPSAVVYDTVAPATDTALIVSGFEKTLRATRESMFVTNRSGAPVAGFTLEITYRDLHGRMLHRAVRTVGSIIPDGETRRVDIPTFDRQNLFYYRLTEPPQRASQATPFDVTIKVLNLIYPSVSE